VAAHNRRVSRRTESGQLTYSGEVWTDARGYATVPLPRSVGRLHGSLDYELRPFTHGVTATVAAQLVDGRFTIETDEPHVKVAWRVTGRRPQPQSKEGQ
jgi:hypothetical protein